jgi:predicted PurR-regulated permease PerM
MPDELRFAGPEPTRSQQVALAALGLTLIVFAAYILQGFLRALVWGVIFALAVWPLYARTRRRWPARGHGMVLPAVFTLGVTLIFLVPLVAFGVQIGREAASVVRAALEYQHTGIPVPEFVGNLPVGGQMVSRWWQANLSDPDSLSALLGRINRDEVIAYSEGIGTRLLHRVLTSAFTLLALFFLLRDGETIANQLHRAAVRAFGERGGRVGAQAIASVHGTVNGVVLVGIGEGILIGIGYWLAGVPHPTLLGGLTAMAAMVPFGAPVVFGVAAVILLAQGSLIPAVALFAFGAVVTFVADHFVRPVIIGGATRLPFMWVLLGILGGVETFGIIGLFIGPVVMSVLILLWREWVGNRSTEGSKSGRRR